MNFHNPQISDSLIEVALKKRIERRVNNTPWLRKKTLEHYANDSMFDIYNKDGRLIPTQRKFIPFPLLPHHTFLELINTFPDAYALFTDSRQTLPYIFSNKSGEFRTLVSPEPNGYSREHITQSYLSSQKPELYWLHREFN